MNDSALYYLKKLKAKYLGLRVGEIILIAAAIGIFAYAFFRVINQSLTSSVVLSLVAFAITFFTLFRNFGLHRLTHVRIVSYINQKYPILQESADLLLKDVATLNVLEQIQYYKTVNHFNNLYPSIKFPHKLMQGAIMVVISIGISIGLLSFTKAPDYIVTTPSDLTAQNETVITKLPASIKQVVVKITPPAYSSLRAQTTQDLHLNVLEGTTVAWEVQFSDDVDYVKLIFSGGDSIAMVKESGKYNLHKTFKKSSFYQIAWTNKSGEHRSSDYYKIEITLDQAPEIKVQQLTQFTELKITDKLSFDLKTSLSDDFGLKDAYIIATVSKGSGESVKFREEKLVFTTPKEIRGKNVQASRNVDLIKLGLEPGDELYFYVEAFDNKTPLANRSRTETYFIALKDTASQTMSIEGGLGVDLMPEYFRSQRQIIIDSEKILRDRKKITKEEFNFKSNELGYDQKILRLKYGEFLGEEFESSIGPGQELPVDDGEHHEEQSAEELSKQFGHVHDKENEHNLVPDKKHDHGNEGDPDKKENIADAYKHVHDDPEEATFFTQSIRAKLKAALTVMWDAELHLRMYDPEKSLPYQYQALKLLKEISNDSRIYVHKTGFDPPPIKEDKRLTGDLSEIKNSKKESEVNNDELNPSLKAGLALLEKKLQSLNVSITANDKQILLKAGNELAAFALTEPGNYLEALSLIKAVNEGQIASDKLQLTLAQIRQAFWEALPREKMLPTQSTQTTHALDRAFIKNLEELKND